MLLASNAALVIAVVVLIQMAGANHERVVVVTPTINSPYTIGWNTATPAYYKGMGYYFSGVIASINPRNVTYISNLIERFCAPDVADGIKNRLRAMSADYQFQQSTSNSWFVAEKALWEPRTGLTFVSGTLHATTSGGVASREVTYEYKILIREGQPVITHFDSYDGLTPHTLEYLSDPKLAEANAKRKQQDAARTQTDVNNLNAIKQNRYGARVVGGGQ